MGMDRGPCDKTCHSRMDELSEEEERFDALTPAPTKRWAGDVPDEDAIILADMHCYPHSGDEGILPKNRASSMRRSLQSTAAPASIFSTACRWDALQEVIGACVGRSSATWRRG